MLYCLLFTNPLLSVELFERFLIGALSSLLGAFVIYIFVKLFGFLNKISDNKQTKTFVKEKAKSFIHSSNQDSSDYYGYLLEELLEKCNPKNFMRPYDYEKVRIANQLYYQLQACNKNDKNKILQLCDDAVNRLGISSPASSVYDELCKICNPERFMSPYDPVKVAKANELYSRVLYNRNNLKALVRIKDEARELLGNNSQHGRESQNLYTTNRPDNTKKPVNASPEISLTTFFVSLGIIILVIAFIILVNAVF